VVASRHVINKTLGESKTIKIDYPEPAQLKDVYFVLDNQNVFI